MAPYNSIGGFKNRDDIQGYIISDTNIDAKFYIWTIKPFIPEGGTTLEEIWKLNRNRRSQVKALYINFGDLAKIKDRHDMLF